MSDAALRDLERRWRASDDPADEARLLAERLRRGDLPRERLELAAILGHQAARGALGEGAPAGRLPLRRAVAQLDAAGVEALLRDGAARVEGLGLLTLPPVALEEERLQQLELLLAALARVPDDGRPSALVGWALGPDHAASPRAGVEAPGAARRYLADRARRGELTRGRLELAAYAGDETAVAVLGLAPEPPAPLASWVAGLDGWDPDLPARAVAALAGAGLARPLMRWWAREAPVVVASTARTDALVEVTRGLLLWAGTPTPPLRARLERVLGVVDDLLADLAKPVRGAPLQGVCAALACALGRLPPHKALSQVQRALDEPGAAFDALRRTVAGWALE